LVNEKAAIEAVPSGISNANGGIRQTGWADYRRWLPLFKVAAGNGEFFGLKFLDLP
jgi:hypothetical protein